MAVIRKEAYFNSSTGVNKIRTLIWQEDTLTPIGVFQIAHGMAEHIERYDEFARFLASNGFVVCGNDHLGHGKSVNSIADLGFFAEKDGDKRMVDDMHILTKIMKKKFPELPYFLFGHSMGSFCARVYAAHFGEELSGVIFCGTGELPSIASTFRMPIEKLAEKLGPHTEVNFLGDVFNMLCNLMVPDSDAPTSWLSKNRENQEKFTEDRLCGFSLKLGGYRDLFNLAVEACASDWAYQVPQGLPVMVISGAKDPVGFNGKGVISVADNLALADKNPTVILYPGDRHEILNEDDREIVFGDILAWLNSIYTSF